MTVKEIQQLSGLIPATFTPLKPDGKPNLEVIPQYVKNLGDNGIEYIFINGTTGEGPLFTIAERKTLTEAWLQAAKDVLRGVMVHVGAGNMHESCELARHAEKCGAIAVSTAPSTYFKPSSAKDLVAYCQVVADGAPELPFYYYHIPGLTGVDLPIDDIYALGIDVIPNFRGIKYSSIDTISLGFCLKIKKNYPRHQFFWGVDEAIIAAIDNGLSGCIGSTYNMMAPIGNLVMALQRRGERDRMMEWLFVIQDYIQILKRHAKETSSISVQKATMSYVSGLEMGPARLPLASITDRSRLLSDLENMKLVEKIGEAKALLSKL